MGFFGKIGHAMGSLPGMHGLTNTIKKAPGMNAMSGMINRNAPPGMHGMLPHDSPAPMAAAPVADAPPIMPGPIDTGPTEMPMPMPQPQMNPMGQMAAPGMHAGMGFRRPGGFGGMMGQGGEQGGGLWNKYNQQRRY
jgi:hypothetical protein